VARGPPTRPTSGCRLPSFLVLEEDGTSHLETEEDTDDLLLEEDAGPPQILVAPRPLGGGSW
jgi:hypothetical protein